MFVRLLVQMFCEAVSKVFSVEKESRISRCQRSLFILDANYIAIKLRKC